MPILPIGKRRPLRRLAFAPALVVAILALTACTSGGPPTPAPTAAPTDTPVSAATKPASPTAAPTAATATIPASSPTPTAAPTPTNTPASPVITIDLNIANRAAGLARQDLRVKRGDTVFFNITSDEPGEIHLHGYNLTAPVAPDAPGELTVQAHTAGAFGINFHAFAPLPSDANTDNAGGGGSGAMSHDPIESTVPIAVAIAAIPEADGGVSVAITTDNWQWTPEQVNGANAAGAGHAHIYVNDEKINRVYGPHYHLKDLPPGDHEIRVTLNANDHSGLLRDGQPVVATATITVPDAGHSHDANPEPVAATDPMSVDISVDSDPDGGYNLNVIPNGFAFAGANANQPHRPGVWEGHAYVDLDGINHARLYEPWLKLPALEPGEHTITVRLAANDRRPYYYDGQPVAASITLDVEDTDGGGHDSHGSSHSHGDGHSHGSHDTAGAREIIAEVHLGNLEVYP